MKKDKIRVLVIPTGGMGMEGITSSIMNYYKNINHKLIEFTFITTYVIGSKEYYKTIQLEIINNGDNIIQLDRSSNLIKYLYNLLKLMSEKKFDVIHVHGSSCIMSVELLAAKICRIPIRIAHSHNTKCSHEILNKILRPIFNSLVTDRIACGIDAGKWLFKEYEFKVLRNGIPFDKFKFCKNTRVNIREKLSIADKKVIGHIGNFNDQKNQSFTIDILEELIKIDPSYHLILVGDGVNKKSVEKKVKNKKLENQVTFLGIRDDVHELLQGMDVMVLPSLYEGVPLVAIEWQVAGIKSFLADTITNEVELTDLIKFIPLTSSAKVWANIINNNVNYERECIDELDSKISKYNITSNVNELLSIYKADFVNMEE